MRRVTALLALVSLASACVPASSPPPTTARPTAMPTTARPGGGSPCGDGICRSPEDGANCPQDCAAASDQAPLADAPLFMTTMTHMEQGFDDDTNQAVFLLHVDQLRYGMDLFDAYGARMTVESEQPFARANALWGLNIMAEIFDRGHGVGTHCDIGFREPRMPVEEFASLLRENKELVDALVGAEDNRGCSGAGGVNDWALAAHQAGFEYLDGIVGMHYLAMPLSSRPDPTWTDDYIIQEAFHVEAPVDLEDRIYPFLVRDALDFEPDADGVILVSSGGIGRLDCLVEHAQTGMQATGCPLAEDDVDALVATILEIDEMRDRSRVAKITLYLPVGIFVPENEDILRLFLARTQDLAEQGVIEWATQAQVADAYFARNPR